jgi:uncharacterized protein (DUF302 family)
MDSGITCIGSRHSVAQTIERLESLINERDLMIFARIDCSDDARACGAQSLRALGRRRTHADRL